MGLILSCIKIQYPPDHGMVGWDQNYELGTTQYPPDHGTVGWDQNYAKNVLYNKLLSSLLMLYAQVCSSQEPSIEIEREHNTCFFQLFDILEV